MAESKKKWAEILPIRFQGKAFDNEGRKFLLFNPFPVRTAIQFRLTHRSREMVKILKALLLHSGTRLKGLTSELYSRIFSMFGEIKEKNQYMLRKNSDFMHVNFF